MSSSYEEYRISESQYFRYRDVIISFIQEPLTYFYFPENTAPTTAAVDLRALLQALATNPDLFPDLPFEPVVFKLFYQKYSIKTSPQGVFFQARKRAWGVDFSESISALQDLAAKRVRPQVEKPKPPPSTVLPIPEQYINDAKRGLEHEPSKEFSFRHVNNAKAVMVVCRAITFKCFKGPVEMDGVMSDEAIAKYQAKFPDIGFFPRTSTTLIL